MTDIAADPLPGSGRPYVSPYGRFEGLAQRLIALRNRLKQPNSGPFYGGLVADLEVVVRFLNATEFAEHLRVHGNDEEMRWAADILEALDGADENDQMCADIERVVPVADGQPYAEAVEAVAAKAVQYDVVRSVLENCGALEPGDTTTDVPALLRVLLS